MLKSYRSYLIVVALFNLSLSFFFVTFVLFLLKNGLNLLEVNLVNAAMVVSVFIFEIPTGAYADFWGRKNSFLLGCLIIAASTLLYFLSRTFVFFLLAEIVQAIGITFQSGALEAWLVDSLKHEGHKGEFDKFFAMGSMVSQAAGVFGALIGAYVGEVNLAVPWLLSTFGMLITFLVGSIIMGEDYFTRKQLGVREGLWKIVEIARVSFDYGIKHRSVFSIIMVTTVVGFFIVAPNMYWSPYLKDLGGKVWILGWVWVLISLSMILGSYLTKRYSNKFVDKTVLLIGYILVMGVSLACASVVRSFYPVLVGFLLHEVGRGGFRPSKMAYINAFIPSEKRATLISFDSMMGHLGVLLGLVVMGLIGKHYSIPATWLVSSFVVLLAIPLLLLARQSIQQNPLGSIHNAQSKK